MAADETTGNGTETEPSPPVLLPPPAPGYGPLTWGLRPRGNVQVLKDLANTARQALARFGSRPRPPEAEAALGDLERNIRKLE
jgi:hypothetical protein